MTIDVRGLATHLQQHTWQTSSHLDMYHWQTFRERMLPSLVHQGVFCGSSSHHTPVPPTHRDRNHHAVHAHPTSARPHHFCVAGTFRFIMTHNEEGVLCLITWPSCSLRSSHKSSDRGKMFLIRQMKVFNRVQTPCNAVADSAGLLHRIRFTMCRHDQRHGSIENKLF